MSPEELLTALDLKLKELEIQKKRIDMQVTQLKAEQDKVKQFIGSQNQQKSSLLERLTGSQL